MERNIIEVKFVNNDKDKILFEVTIQNKDFISLCDSYDFKQTLERAIAERIIKELPIEKINEITNRLDLNAIAKIATVELAQRTAGKNY